MRIANQGISFRFSCWFPLVSGGLSIPCPLCFFWQEVAYPVNLLFQKLAIFLLSRDICSEWVFQYDTSATFIPLGDESHAVFTQAVYMAV